METSSPAETIRSPAPRTMMRLASDKSTLKNVSLPRCSAKTTLPAIPFLSGDSRICSGRIPIVVAPRASAWRPVSRSPYASEPRCCRFSRCFCQSPSVRRYRLDAPGSRRFGKLQCRQALRVNASSITAYRLWTQGPVNNRHERSRTRDRQRDLRVVWHSGDTVPLEAASHEIGRAGDCEPALRNLRSWGE
jgi:hypothetical protein